MYWSEASSPRSQKNKKEKRDRVFLFFFLTPLRHSHTKFERLVQAKETQLRCIAWYVCDNLRKNLTVIHTCAMSSHLHCIFLFFWFLRHLVELMPSTWILLWTWMFHVILRRTFTGLDELADLVSITAVTFWLSLWENAFYWPVINPSPPYMKIDFNLSCGSCRDIRSQGRCTTGRPSWKWTMAWFAKKKMQIVQRIDALENSYYIWFLLTT